MAAYKRKYPNIPDVVALDNRDGPQFPRRQDPMLEFPDEADAYNKFRSQGYFTANPAAGR